MASTSADSIFRDIERIFAPGFEVESTFAERGYEIAQEIGRGGFGIAFGAYDDGGQAVCVKVLCHKDSWLQEAYFGVLLRNTARVVKLLDHFPYGVTHGRRQFAFYILVFEYAPGGDISDYLTNKSGPWPESRARKEVGALLEVLTALHAAGTMHRDISPGNVLVTAGGKLKLADFGLAKQEFGGKKIKANAFTPIVVSNNKLVGRHRHWQMEDDVFQMGQLLANLVIEEPWKKVDRRHIRSLTCSDETKDIIAKAVGPRQDRYPNAYEMLLAIEGRTIDRTVVRTLRGKNIVFTGKLSVRRADAELLASQNGASVQGKVRSNTDIVVVGGRSPAYSDGIRGTKLKAVDKLNAKGSRIRIINEPQFMRLVG